MRLKNLDIFVAMLVALMNVGWALLPSHPTLVGTILALPLVFVLPGYTLTEALFHKKSLNISERLLFSIGLSLAIDILGGLVLNMLPGGLQEISWALLLGPFIVAFSLLAMYLRRGVQMNQANPVRFRFIIYPWIMFGLAMLIAIFSVVYAAIGAVQQPHPGFTQFWMLPAVQPGKSCAVRLGVQSFEPTSITYRITMTVMGAQVTSLPSIILAPQQQWNQLVSVIPKRTDNVYVEAQLYRLDKPQTVYREVHLTLPNCSTSSVTATSYLGLARTYKGTIYDIQANVATNMSLTRMQESDGNIDGYFTAHTLMQESEPFRGGVNTAKQIQFMITDSTGHIVLSFNGAVQSDGTIAGSYCSLDQEGKCNGKQDYGIWSVTPTSP